MAEEQGQERSELPTPKRLLKAHEEGQVPRSQELNAAVVLLAGSAGVMAFGGSTIGAHAAETLRVTTSWLAGGEMTATGATWLIRDLAKGTVAALLPVLLCIAVPVAVIGGIQARGVLSLKPITPSFDRVSPFAGAKRIFGAAALFTLFKSMLKLALLSVTAWLALSALWPRIAGLAGAGAADVLTAMQSATARLVLLTGLAFLVVAAADYGYQAWQHAKQLRMTRQEVVQEHKESEGDPQLKSRIRSLQQQMSRRRMLHKVKEADVVVVNPTNIAIALKYDPAQATAPVVLAMGRRKFAERIRDVATKAGVPLVRNVPVARALIASAKVGLPIPPALYAAVAEVLAFVYRQRGRVPREFTDRSRA